MALAVTTETLEVNESWVGGGSCDDELGLVLEGYASDGVVVQPSGRLIDSVARSLEVLAGEVDRTAVGEVPTVRQVVLNLFRKMPFVRAIKKSPDLKVI